jgi:hypothetical protein
MEFYKIMGCISAGILFGSIIAEMINRKAFKAGILAFLEVVSVFIIIQMLYK